MEQADAQFNFVLVQSANNIPALLGMFSLHVMVLCLVSSVCTVLEALCHS